MDSQNPAPESELHLIVLWETARGKEKEILEDMQKHVRILQAYDIQWTRERVADNFSRFYGVKLPDKSFKEIECGAGAFLLLVVRDEHPQYGYVETSRGHEQANLTLFSLKEKYREWTNGGCKIHTTNSVAETNHDACLMLGKNYADLDASVPDAWDGSITRLHRDITGADGWESMQQFFYTLNATADYVVLRGFEKMQETLASAEHGDIDIMVRHCADVALLVGGTYFNPNGRPHYLVRIGENKVFIDLWDINNHYHDPKWDEDILATAELHEGLIRVPRLENYFYMMVYHCLINKRRIAKDYTTLLADLFSRTGLAAQYDTAGYASPFDLYFELLRKFMHERRYRFVRPQDPAVFYSEKLVNADKTAEQLQCHFRLKDVCVCHTEAVGNAYNLFLTAYDTDGTKLFIKCGSERGIYRNEYRMGKALWDMDSRHFVRPVYYRDNDDYCFCACEYLQGLNLETALEKGTLTEARKADMIVSLRDIHRDLVKSDVLHRDIRPANFVICGDTLKLIDFQLAVSKKQFYELPLLQATPLMNYYLGADYAPEPCVWDDSYSMLKVIEAIGRADSYGELYDAVHSEISAAVGTARVAHPRRARILRQFDESFHPEKKSLFRRMRHFLYRKEKESNGKRRVYLFGIRLLTYGKVK